MNKTLGGEQRHKQGGKVWPSCLFPMGELEGVATLPSWEVAGEASRRLALGSSSWEDVCPTPPCLWLSADGLYGQCPNKGS